MLLRLATNLVLIVHMLLSEVNPIPWMLGLATNLVSVFPMLLQELDFFFLPPIFNLECAGMRKFNYSFFNTLVDQSTLVGMNAAVAAQVASLKQQMDQMHQAPVNSKTNKVKKRKFEQPLTSRWKR